MRAIRLVLAFLMKRRTCVWGLIGTLIAPCAALAQQEIGPAKIGILASASQKTSATVWAAFRQGLRDLGWEDGRNIIIEARFADGKSIDYTASPRNCCTSTFASS
jgi:hypothetical protein